MLFSFPHFVLTVENFFPFKLTLFSPHRDQYAKLRLPQSIEDAKVLREIFSSYTQTHFFTVLGAYCMLYLAYDIIFVSYLKLLIYFFGNLFIRFIWIFSDYK